MSSRSSIFRSVLGASSNATGGSVYSPLRRSAGALAVGSGSDSGSGGVGRLTFGGFDGANDLGLPNAGAGAGAGSASRRRGAFAASGSARVEPPASAGGG